MAQFHVYPNPTGSGYLLDVQADILETMKTRVVVSLLRPQRTLIRTPRLNPIIMVEDVDHLMVTQSLSAVPAAILRKPVAVLWPQSDVIRDALNFLLIGF
jgi:toxin CcdB